LCLSPLPLRTRSKPHSLMNASLNFPLPLDLLVLPKRWSGSAGRLRGDRAASSKTLIFAAPPSEAPFLDAPNPFSRASPSKSIRSLDFIPSDAYPFSQGVCISLQGKRRPFAPQIEFSHRCSALSRLPLDLLDYTSSLPASIKVRVLIRRSA